MAIMDISQRKQIEQTILQANSKLEASIAELRMAQDQLIQQERIRALGQMACGVAHDLNNSLSPVLGYVELLSNDSRLPKDVREKLAHIYAGAGDATAVVERLQQFYRQEENVFYTEDVKLKELIEQIPALTQPKWRDAAQQTGREVSIELKLKDVPRIRGNVTELRQVLVNLVLNAVDAMSTGGQITIRLYTEVELVMIEVSDNGIGMTSNECKRCFEPFFTTKSDGSGLGLSVCHGIVDRHGGRIEVESQPGQGTTFRIVLPQTKKSVAAVLPDSGRRDDLPHYKILHIEDDPRVWPVVKAMLEELGQDVDLAESGAAGLGMFEANRYDAVITDLGMANIDGYQVVRAIRAKRPDIPVVMLTGWAKSEVLAAAHPDDIPTHILAKPPTLESLRNCLAKIQLSVRQTKD